MGVKCLRCDRADVWSRGYCGRCYSYLRKSGELLKIHGKEIPRVLMQDEDEKPCGDCGKVKKGYEFWAEKKARDGKQSRCRDCSNARRRQWVKNNPVAAQAIRDRRAEEAKAEWRKWRYGVTAEEYGELLALNDGMCHLCGGPPKNRPLGIDHDHHTGQVRGLLCSPCNTGLGKLGDSIEGLERALAYLKGSTAMAGKDIRKVSKAVDAPILKQGHTTNGDFGSNPSAKVLGGRQTRDITIPTAR